MATVRAGATAAAAAIAALLATAGAAGAQDHAEAPEMRDARYCEIIPVVVQGTAVTSSVYNTIGLNDCPADLWSALTEAQVNAEYGSQASKLNGPRHFVMDHSAAAGSSAAGETFTFGGIEAKLVARLVTKLGEPTVGDQYYRPNRVQRETQWTYDRGKLIYKLVDPSGAVYVMQSYAQIVDPNLTIDQLAGLGSRLNLPEGWRFATRRLRHTMTMTAEGQTSVVNDDLLNTYQVMRKPQTRISGAPRGCIDKRTTLRVHVDGDTALTRVFVGGRRVAETTDADVKVTVKPSQVNKKPAVVATSRNDAGVSRAHVRVTACG
jgi:hypothetical protein